MLVLNVLQLLHTILESLIITTVERCNGANGISKCFIKCVDKWAYTSAANRNHCKQNTL